MHTYCNPLDLEYRYQHMREGKQVAFREGADPTLVLFRDVYYLFVSMSAGFWYSVDLLHWHFHSNPELLIYDYAPNVRQIGDSLYFCASRRGKNCPILKTEDPLSDVFIQVSAPFDFWDPDLFWDDDGRTYLYWGCGNTDPIFGVEMDPKTMLPMGEPKPLIYENVVSLGYERPGDNGVLFCNQCFEDYPMAVPQGKFDPWDLKPQWMLINYGCKVTASSTVPGSDPALAVNEYICTWWSAASAEKGQWLCCDLGREKDIRAIQVNLADE